MLIATWSDKGGTGKTTLAIQAAVYFNAGLLDLDPQQDFALWAKRAGRPCEILPEDSSALAARLVQAAEDERVWIVDAPPGKKGAGVYGMAFSQLVIIPTRSGDQDIAALGRALDQIHLVRQNGNPDIAVGVVLNAVRDTARSRWIATTLAHTGQGFSFLGEVRERILYEDTYTSGSSVLNYKGEASAETRQVMEKIRVMSPALGKLPPVASLPAHTTIKAKEAHVHA